MHFIEDKNMFKAVMFVKRIHEQDKKDIDHALDISSTHYNVNRQDLLSEYDRHRNAALEKNPEVKIIKERCRCCNRPFED